MRSLSKFYCVDPIMAKEAGYQHNSSCSLENFVFSELKRRYKEIWYWHSKNKFEIDFIVKDKMGDLIAFQVTESIKEDKTKERELRAITDSFKEIDIKKAFIITEFEFGEEKIGSDFIKIIPFYRWALDKRL